MNPSKHCELCDNKLFDIKTGILCGLTKEKPAFYKSCPEIKFDKNYEEEIRAVNIGYRLVEMTRTYATARFLAFSSIGLIVMVSGFLIGKYALDQGVIATLPLIIMGSGFLMLPVAIAPFSKFRRSIAVARQKKQAVDDVLSQYSIQYTIDVNIHTDRHGNREVDADLTFLRKHIK